MNKAYPFVELQQQISEAQKILLALPPRPDFDQVASALALYLSLQASGKTVFVVCPTPMTVEFNHLVGVDKISDKIEGSDLIVSFDYPADQIERVSYNDDNNRPNLVIQVKAGAPRISQNLARFSYAGEQVDLALTFGIRDLPNIAGSYPFLPQKIVNLDTDPANRQYGQVKVVDSEASCLSEVVLGVISGLGLPLDVDIAQNILLGIWTKTHALTHPKVSADTYEAVAICLRLGAQKPQFNFQNRRPTVFSSPKREEKRQEKTISQFQEQPKPEGETSEPPPPDWFEPKIFKSNTSI